MRANVVLGILAMMAMAACRPEPGYRDTDWQDETGPGASECERWLGCAEDAASSNDLEVALIMGVMRVESGFREDAESHAGALGLMQVMPATGEHFGCDDLSDGESNVRCGARVLADYLQRLDGDVEYGLAAYNAGIANAQRWKRAGEPPANVQYVRRVLQFRDRFEREGCAGLAADSRKWEVKSRSSLSVSGDDE